MRQGRHGTIVTPAQGQAPPEGARWCADNGCFGKGFPGVERWIAWLRALPYDKSLCEFATAPDVVGDAVATLERSRPWLPLIRSAGFPAALVAQDGLEHLEVPWEEFDVLFIGGSTEWKLGPEARRLVGEARARGMRVHMGRVNTRDRLRYAAAIGCTSADGTAFTFGAAINLDRFDRWVAELKVRPPQPTLEGL